MERQPIPKPPKREKKKPKPLKRSYIKRNPNAKPLKRTPLKRSQKPIKCNKQPKRNDSIMTEFKEGYNFEPHEIFFGRQHRLICFEHGLWCWLSHDDHVKAHNDREYDLHLKRICQRRFEQTHTREDFMNLIGRNYLD